MTENQAQTLEPKDSEPYWESTKFQLAMIFQYTGKSNYSSRGSSH